MEVFVRQPYNYDMMEASDASGLKCLDKSLTQQSFAEEVDINTIVRRFNLTGEVPEGYVAPSYGDFTGITDYHSAMNAVAKAGEAFDELPAQIRARFHNDPQELLEFLGNEENRAEAVKLGIVQEQAKPAPEPTPSPAPAPAPAGS